jgi:mRNA-degrading endonuclease toxin of MazEF toxin-antitoxin module
VKQIPKKPNVYVWGSICLVEFPKQPLRQVTDGRVREGEGVEQSGSHRAVVVSSNDFNERQGRGVIVIPMTSATDMGKEKYKIVQPTWVRVIHQGEPALVLCEQIRYADKVRCGKAYGRLSDLDRSQVAEKVSKLLARPIVEVDAHHVDEL